MGDTQVESMRYPPSLGLPGEFPVIFFVVVFLSVEVGVSTGLCSRWILAGAFGRLSVVIIS